MALRISSVTLLSLLLLVRVTVVMSEDSVTEQLNITPQYMNQADIVTSDAAVQHVQMEAPLLSNTDSIRMKTITRASASTQLESGWCIILRVKIYKPLNLYNIIYSIGKYMGPIFRNF